MPSRLTLLLPALVLAGAGAGYAYWNRAPEEPVAPVQEVATECEDALANWRTVRADPSNENTRTAFDALEAAEGCSYQATGDDAAFATEQ